MNTANQECIWKDQCGGVLGAARTIHRLMSQRGTITTTLAS